MSMFLPDESGQPQDGVSSITPPSAETTLEDIALMQRVLGAAAHTPNAIPDELMSYIVDYIQASNLNISIGRVFGFSGFTANVATVATLEGTPSTSYTDLATVGPTIDGLANGRYVVVVAAAAVASAAGVDCWMSYSANGDTATDARGSRSSTAPSISGLVMFSTVVLNAGGGNSLQSKYKTSGGTSSFTNRCLFALKYGNL
jgi:hypothetical protein